MAKKYTEEQLEELVIQLEEMCESGVLPTHRCPVGSDEYKLAEALHNHRKQFSQKQKNRIEAAKKLAKEKTKTPRRPPYTAEQIENIVIRMEEMCSKGILPAVTCPKGSEELKLAYLVISHNYQFSPKQKKRIKTARSLAKKIIKFQNDKISSAEEDKRVDDTVMPEKEIAKNDKVEKNDAEKGGVKRRGGGRQKFTPEQLEDIVIRFEEMCNKGILPTNKSPKYSEELKLAHAINNHSHRFSSSQKTRIKKAKSSVRKRTSYSSEQLETFVLQLEDYSNRGIHPSLRSPKGSEELKLISRIYRHKHQFTEEQLERIKRTNSNVKLLESRFMQFEEMFLNGHCPSRNYPTESPEYKLCIYLKDNAKRLSQDQKDYIFCARKLSKMESDIVYGSAEDRLEQYKNNVIQFCKERNHFPFMNRKAEEQLYYQMQILLLGSYESRAASNFRKFHEEMMKKFKQTDKRHNSESRLMMTNINASEMIQNTPYVEAVKKYETKIDRLTEENKEMVERILSDNMTKIRFEARCNALKSVQTEGKFLDLMEIFDFWPYQAAYEIYRKKFGKELA